MLSLGVRIASINADRSVVANTITFVILQEVHPLGSIIIEGVGRAYSEIKITHLNAIGVFFVSRNVWENDCIDIVVKRRLAA